MLLSLVAVERSGLGSLKWLEILAHRVLEVERHELTNEFDVYDEAGEKL
jgi:hypothetical protein